MEVAATEKDAWAEAAKAAALTVVVEGVHMEVIEVVALVARMVEMAVALTVVATQVEPQAVVALMVVVVRTRRGAQAEWAEAVRAAATAARWAVG